MRLAAAMAAPIAFVLAPALACSAVVGTPLSEAPVNACGAGLPSCDSYVVKGVAAKPQCNLDLVTSKSRCDVGRPDYPYTIVVNVPDSSFYAPGRTFVLTNNDFAVQPGAPVIRECRLPGCIQLPELVTVEGKYLVTAAAAVAAGMPLPDKTSIPVRVSFVPFAPDADVEALSNGLPLDELHMSSRLIRKAKGQPTEVSFLDAISVGRYLRIESPEPPFDAFFPPAFKPIVISQGAAEDFLLGDPLTPLDDESGRTRTTTIKRKEGLDGWRVWLADAPPLGGRRISSIKMLSGVEAKVTLHTVGATQPGSRALREDVDIVIAPPDGSLGVPRVQSLIPNGGPFGFEFLDVPPLPAPTTFTGVVAQGDGALTGIPSRLLFTSNGLRKRDGQSDATLKYSTAVSTDDAGRFATVLPVGFYDVTIEPVEGTGLSKVKATLDTTVTLKKTFLPPPRTLAFGRAVLADGRPLSEATVLALPSNTSLVGRAVKPRPARARTDRDGNFRFEVDQGQYNLVIEPQPGTDFPRVVQIRSFAGVTADVGEIVVAPPARLAFQIKDPSGTANPIVRAMVRIFAELPGRGPPAIEIGEAMTDADGRCEILLAQQAR